MDAVRVAKVVGDPMGIGDDGIGPAGAAGLRPSVVARRAHAPLGPLPLESVDVHRHRDPGRPQGGEEGRVRGVEDDRDIGMLPGDRMTDGQARVAQGLGRPVAHGGEVDQSHAEVLGLGLAGVAAVDHHVVAALDEPSADLLSGGLEAAVACGNSPGPEQGDPHQPTDRCTGRSRVPDHSRPAARLGPPGGRGQGRSWRRLDDHLQLRRMGQRLGIGVDLVGPGLEGSRGERVLHHHRRRVTGLGLVALPEHLPTSLVRERAGASHRDQGDGVPRGDPGVGGRQRQPVGHPHPGPQGEVARVGAGIALEPLRDGVGERDAAADRGAAPRGQLDLLGDAAVLEHRELVRGALGMHCDQVARPRGELPAGRECVDRLLKVGGVERGLEVAGRDCVHRAPDRGHEVQRLGQVRHQRFRELLVARMSLDHALWAVELPVGVHQDGPQQVLRGDRPEARRLDSPGPGQHRGQGTHVDGEDPVNLGVAQRGPRPTHVHRGGGEVRMEVRVHERVALALPVPGGPTLVLPLDRRVVRRQLGLQLPGDRDRQGTLVCLHHERRQRGTPGAERLRVVEGRDQVALGLGRPKGFCDVRHRDLGGAGQQGQVRDRPRHRVGDGADRSAQRSRSLDRRRGLRPLPPGPRGRPPQAPRARRPSGDRWLPH